MKNKILLGLGILIAVVLISGCIQEQSSTGIGPEIMIVPEEITIYQTYLSTIGGNAAAPYDIGTIEGTVVSILNSEACPYDEESCRIEPYPQDAGKVRIDKIINYKTYAQQGAESPTDVPTGSPIDSGNVQTTPEYEGVQTTPEYEGMGIAQEEPTYKQLQVGQEVTNTIFVLTTRPVKVNYISIEPKAGPELASSESATDTVEQNVSARVEPLPRTYKPIPKEGDYYVFTTKIIQYPETSQKTLPGLEIGSKFRAEIKYKGVLYIEEYQVI